MTKAKAAQKVRARHLLVHEAASEERDAASAAGRVYDKLHAQLAPLIGPAGAHLLFLRSAKLAHGDFGEIADALIHEASTKLRECLRALDPDDAMERAEDLFGTLLTLTIAFIGERLTTQVLRNAWPTLEEMTSRESHK